jgi:hypothetical protein
VDKYFSGKASTLISAFRRCRHILDRILSENIAERFLRIYSIG